MKKKQKKSSKICALFTLITYLTSPSAWAAPAIDAASLLKSSEVSKQIPSFTLPSELGTVIEKSSETPAIYLIQDAHGHYQAQKSSEEILDFLARNGKISSVLIEGGSGKQEPERLAFFKETDLNLKVADALMRVAQIGGAERFLLKNLGRFDAYGIEEPGLYLKGLRLYQGVAARQKEAGAWVAGTLSGIQAESSKNFSKELFEFFKEYAAFENETSELPAYLQQIEKRAAKNFKLDLRNPRSQLKWPMLVRYFELQRREGLLKPEAAERQRKLLIEWSVSKKLPENIIRNLRPAGRKGEFDLRNFWEKFYEAASHSGFRFEDYPDLALLEGYKVLESEIDFNSLQGEILKVQEKLFAGLAKTRKEHEILGKYRGVLLLKKLFSLSLTRQEFLDLSAQKQPDLPGRLKSAYQNALDFYRSAFKRDAVMSENISALLKKAKGPSALIAGGFHTRGLCDYFRDQNISYAVISPHVRDFENSSNYVDAMTGVKKQIDFEASTYRFVTTWMQDWDLPASNKTQRDFIEQQIYAFGKKRNAYFLPRSEMRMREFDDIPEVDAQDGVDEESYYLKAPEERYRIPREDSALRREALMEAEAHQVLFERAKFRTIHHRDLLRALGTVRGSVWDKHLIRYLNGLANKSRVLKDKEGRAWLLFLQPSEINSQTGHWYLVAQKDAAFYRDIFSRVTAWQSTGSLSPGDIVFLRRLSKPKLRDPVLGILLFWFSGPEFKAGFEDNLWRLLGQLRDVLEKSYPVEIIQSEKKGLRRYGFVDFDEWEFAQDNPDSLQHTRRIENLTRSKAGVFLKQDSRKLLRAADAWSFQKKFGGTAVSVLKQFSVLKDQGKLPMTFSEFEAATGNFNVMNHLDKLVGSGYLVSRKKSLRELVYDITESGMEMAGILKNARSEMRTTTGFDARLKEYFNLLGPDTLTQKEWEEKAKWFFGFYENPEGLTEDEVRALQWADKLMSRFTVNGQKNLLSGKNFNSRLKNNPPNKSDIKSVLMDFVSFTHSRLRTLQADQHGRLPLSEAAFDTSIPLDQLELKDLLDRYKLRLQSKWNGESTLLLHDYIEVTDKFDEDSSFHLTLILFMLIAGFDARRSLSNFAGMVLLNADWPVLSVKVQGPRETARNFIIPPFLVVKNDIDPESPESPFTRTFVLKKALPENLTKDDVIKPSFMEEYFVMNEKDLERYSFNAESSPQKRLAVLRELLDLAKTGRLLIQNYYFLGSPKAAGRLAVFLARNREERDGLMFGLSALAANVVESLSGEPDGLSKNFSSEELETAWNWASLHQRLGMGGVKQAYNRSRQEAFQGEKESTRAARLLRPQELFSPIYALFLAGRRDDGNWLIDHPTAVKSSGDWALVFNALTEFETKTAAAGLENDYQAARRAVVQGVSEDARAEVENAFDLQAAYGFLTFIVYRLEKKPAKNEMQYRTESKLKAFDDKANLRREFVRLAESVTGIDSEFAPVALNTRTDRRKNLEEKLINYWMRISEQVFEHSPEENTFPLTRLIRRAAGLDFLLKSKEVPQFETNKLGTYPWAATLRPGYFAGALQATVAQVRALNIPELVKKREEHVETFFEIDSRLAGIRDHVRANRTEQAIESIDLFLLDSGTKLPENAVLLFSKQREILRKQLEEKKTQHAETWGKIWPAMKELPEVSQEQVLNQAVLKLEGDAASKAGQLLEARLTAEKKETLPDELEKVLTSLETWKTWPEADLEAIRAFEAAVRVKLERTVEGLKAEIEREREAFWNGFTAPFDETRLASMEGHAEACQQAAKILKKEDERDFVQKALQLRRDAEAAHSNFSKLIIARNSALQTKDSGSHFEKFAQKADAWAEELAVKNLEAMRLKKEYRLFGSSYNIYLAGLRGERPLLAGQKDEVIRDWEKAGRGFWSLIESPLDENKNKEAAGLLAAVRDIEAVFPQSPNLPAASEKVLELRRGAGIPRTTNEWIAYANSVQELKPQLTAGKVTHPSFVIFAGHAGEKAARAVAVEVERKLDGGDTAGAENTFREYFDKFKKAGRIPTSLDLLEAKILETKSKKLKPKWEPWHKVSFRAHQIAERTKDPSVVERMRTLAAESKQNAEKFARRLVAEAIQRGNYQSAFDQMRVISEEMQLNSNFFEPEKEDLRTVRRDAKGEFLDAFKAPVTFSAENSKLPAMKKSLERYQELGRLLEDKSGMTQKRASKLLLWREQAEAVKQPREIISLLNQTLDSKFSSKSVRKFRVEMARAFFILADRELPAKDPAVLELAHDLADLGVQFGMHPPSRSEEKQAMWASSNHLEQEDIYAYISLGAKIIQILDGDSGELFFLKSMRSSLADSALLADLDGKIAALNEDVRSELRNPPELEFELDGKKFISLQLIDDGGTAAIYLAEQVNDPSRKLAVKQYPLLMELPGWHEMHLDAVDLELTIARVYSSPHEGLENSHAVPVYAGPEGATYLGMDYVPSKTLDAWLLGNPPLQERIHVARQVLAAVLEAEKRGILHRDIKPRNFLISPDLSVKLIDFAYSQYQGRMLKPEPGLDPSRYARGTVGYFSPEMLTEAGLLTPESDVYQLGLVLYEIMTGRRYSSLPRGTGEEDIPAKKIIYKALKKNKSERFPFVQAMKNAFDLEFPEKRSELRMFPGREIKLEGRLYLITEDEPEQGGMAKVYKAREKNNPSRIIAVKQYSAGFEPYARHEVSVMKAFKSGDNPRGLEVFVPSDEDLASGFFGMPYIQGETLKNWMARNTDPVKRRAMARKIILAVASAHERGIVHMDIKPKNFLISGDEAFLIDFGNSFLNGRRYVHTRSAVRGTLPYLSPEMLDREDLYLANTDVYQLGILLYDGFTVVNIQEKSTREDVVNFHATLPGARNTGQDMVSLESLTREMINPAYYPLASVILKSIDVLPHRRFQTAAELLDAFDAALAAKPAASRSELRVEYEDLDDGREITLNGKEYGPLRWFATRPGVTALYRSVEKATKRPVLFKVFQTRTGDGEDERLRRRFALEEVETFKKVSAAIGEKGLVPQFLDHGEVEGHPAIVMEYVEGQTLDEWRSGRSAKDALEVARLILKGFASLPKDVLYKDFKTNNILVTPGNQIKIIDFGAGMSFPHAAPETENDSFTYFTSASSVYGVASLLYELATEERLLSFYGSVAEMYRRKRNTTITKSQLISRFHDSNAPAWEPVAGVLSRALSVDPADRPQTIAELYDLFEKALPFSPDPNAIRSELRVFPSQLEGHMAAVEGKTYEIKKMIYDRPGMAVVYSGLEKETGRSVIIKVFYGAAGWLAKRELGQMRRLHGNPNVPQVIGFGEVESYSTLVMEKFEGQTIDLWRAKNTAGKLLEKAVPFLKALESIHGRGLLHKDIKPRNIMVISGPGEDIKIIDLGSAGLEVDPDSSGTTPQYAAPETLAGEYLPASEVYSAASVLVELAAQKELFPQKNKGLLREAKENTVWNEEKLKVFLKDAPEWWRVAKVLAEALYVNPGNRPQTVQEFRKKFEAARAQTRSEMRSDGYIIDKQFLLTPSGTKVLRRLTYQRRDRLYKIQLNEQQARALQEGRKSPEYRFEIFPSGKKRVRLNDLNDGKEIPYLNVELTDDFVIEKYPQLSGLRSLPQGLLKLFSKGQQLTSANPDLLDDGFASHYHATLVPGQVLSLPGGVVLQSWIENKRYRVLHATGIESMQRRPTDEENEGLSSPQRLMTWKVAKDDEYILGVPQARSHLGIIASPRSMVLHVEEINAGKMYFQILSFQERNLSGPTARSELRSGPVEQWIPIDWSLKTIHFLMAHQDKPIFPKIRKAAGEEDAYERQYVEGIDMEQWAYAAGALSDEDFEKQIVHWAAKISEAVELMHASGIKHGDLNPRNVVIAAGNQPVLIDFDDYGGYSDLAGIGYLLSTSVFARMLTSVTGVIEARELDTLAKSRFPQLMVLARNEFFSATAWKLILTMYSEELSRRGELRVAKEVTANILAVDVMDELLRFLFPSALIAEDGESRVKRVGSYAELFKAGASAVLPAELLLNVPESVQNQYLDLIEQGFQNSQGRKAVYFAGTGAEKLAELIKIRGSVKTFEAVLQTEVTAAQRRSEDAISVSIVAEPENVKDLYHLPAFLVDPVALKKMEPASALKYLHNLTQLQLLAAVQLKKQLRQGEYAQQMGEFLGQVGIQYKISSSGMPIPSSESLLSETVGTYLRNTELLSTAA